MEEGVKSGVQVHVLIFVEGKKETQGLLWILDNRRFPPMLFYRYLYDFHMNPILTITLHVVHQCNV